MNLDLIGKSVYTVMYECSDTDVKYFNISSIVKKNAGKMYT